MIIQISVILKLFQHFFQLINPEKIKAAYVFHSASKLEWFSLRLTEVQNTQSLLKFECVYRLETIWPGMTS